MYEDLTVSENIEFFGGIYGLKNAELSTAHDQALLKFELEAHRNRLTRDLPAGWKQRLALACCTMHEPKILFLDEPTGGVDPISRREFWQTIYDLTEKGTTVFVTTHYMDEAEYCTRLSIMHEGRIIAIGEPQELKEKYNKKTIQDVFIELVDH